MAKPVKIPGPDHPIAIAPHAGRVVVKVAGAVVALCSAGCGWITGNTISVDGGESIVG